MSSNNFERLAALVFADEAMAAELAALDDPAVLAVRAARLVGAGDGCDFDAAGNDPLGLSRWSPPPLTGRTVPPRHWLPIQVNAGVDITVDWAWFGPKPLRESFYEDSIRRTLTSPFARLFRYRTTLGDLLAQADAVPSRAPDGFIFHMSRCGSTLVAQMLAALPDSIVVSEAAPIDTVTHLARAADDGNSDIAVRALRAIVATLGRCRAGDERRYVIKLDSWHALALPLFRRAFPEVPWVFLYRDPIEVLVSQMRQRGTQMLPQMLPPRFYGIDDDALVPDAEYCARVLAAICTAAADNAELGGGLMIDYRELPEAVTSRIMPHFGIAAGAAERAAMAAAAARDAKAPAREFAADGAAKQREASEAVRQAAERHLDEIHRRLARASAGYRSSISMQMESPR
jgi:hypothetical protein